MARDSHSVFETLPMGAVGAEIGVFKAGFSRAILKRAKPSKLYLIDPWQNFDDPGLEGSLYHTHSNNDMDQVYEDVKKRLAKPVAKGQVEILRGKTEEVADQIPDSSLDFVYIDGDHRYDAVKTDLAISWKKVAPGGLIASTITPSSGVGMVLSARPASSWAPMPM